MLWTITDGAGSANTSTTTCILTMHPATLIQRRGQEVLQELACSRLHVTYSFISRSVCTVS